MHSFEKARFGGFFYAHCFLLTKKNPIQKLDGVSLTIGSAYIMPPIPGSIGGIAGLSSLISVIMHSVVIIRPATDAAA